MKQRTAIYATLIAVFTGAVLAAAAAALIGAMLKSGANLESDEMADLFNFVRTVLVTDATCSEKLHDIEFVPGRSVPLLLAGDYGQNKGPLATGFAFAGERLEIGEFLIEDEGVPPVTLNLNGENVQRHQARIKLKLQQRGGGLERVRFYDIPVYVNALKKIVGCNNQFSAAEACATMGFRYDPQSPGAMPKCMPKSACYAGGIYVLTYGAVACRQSNPATNACTCPKGFSDLPAGSVNLRTVSCGKDCAFTVADTVHHCMLCP